jgi:hypothetical protein
VLRLSARSPHAARGLQKASVTRICIRESSDIAPVVYTTARQVCKYPYASRRQSALQLPSNPQSLPQFTVTKNKRSEVMSKIRGGGNRDTEIAMIAFFRRHGITGWRRNQRIFGKPDFVFPKRGPV